MQSSVQKNSRSEHRVFANLQARYTIVGPTSDGHSPEVRSCMTRSIALSRVVVEGADVPPVGTLLHLSIATLGAWPARISEHLTNGFAVILEIKSSESGKLARRLDWLRRLHNHETKNRRNHQRFALPPLSVELLGEDGARTPGTLYDLSRSGVGIQTASRLPLETPLRINGLPGKVARYFDGGMGIRFDDVYTIEELKQKLLARPAS